MASAPSSFLANMQPSFLDGSSSFRGSFMSTAAAPIVLTMDGPGAAFARPQLGAEWPLISAGFTYPAFNWNCQEASGSLIDTVNGTAFDQNGAGTYGNTVSGWTYKFLGTTEVAQQDWRAAAPLAWNLAAQSVLVIGYMVFTSAGGNRCWFTLSGTSCITQMSSTGLLGVNMNGVLTNGILDHRSASVRPFVLECIPGAGILNHAGAGLLRLSTNIEQITGTWALAGAIDGVQAIGANTSIAPPVARYGTFGVWTGTDAETMSAYTPKRLLQDMGWTVTGY
jgi:hypothetical protein